MPNSKRSPLWFHTPSGQWCKKHKGKVYYFGIDREAAEERHRNEWDAILRGEPRPTIGDIRIVDVVNAFLTSKKRFVDSGELSLLSLHSYMRDGKIILDYFGKERAAVSLKTYDFANLRTHRAKGVGPVTLGKFVIAVRSMFTWAFESGLLDNAIRFGPDFKKPSKEQVRAARWKRGKKYVTPADLRKMIDAANPTMRAMLLLAINCGFGCTDCSDLMRTTVKQSAGWLDTLRVKRAVPRRCPLWKETVAAFKAVHKLRPESADPADSDCVFLTRTGQRFIRHTETTNADGATILSTRNSIGEAYGKLATACGVEHVGGFSAIRHSHKTAADKVLDAPASRLIMGHIDQSIEDHYREHIDDDRLQTITDTVRAWLWPKKKG